MPGAKVARVGLTGSERDECIYIEVDGATLFMHTSSAIHLLRDLQCTIEQYWKMCEENLGEDKTDYLKELNAWPIKPRSNGGHSHDR